ncbi:MAG: D-alanyl-D-alanine carboxypeptidase [Clostridia bacterium]|nr:D-alanyl-D-alanine carboxypeptidase [Clostridia bacterium]
MLKKLICFGLAVILMCSLVSAELLPGDYVFEDDESLQTIAENGMTLNCRSALLMETSSGKILVEKDIDQKLPIASVTKIMTLLLVMEAIDNGSLKTDDIVTVSENAASMGGSQAFMEPGEQMTVHDMLKAVVVSSANDGAVALGEHLAGSEQAFVQKMNLRAKELGMNNTEFINITGLDNTETHLSTARDVAIMSRELLKHSLIFDYTTIWIDSIRDGKFGLSNTNKLIRFYPGANGLKTGSTSKAKFCISASAKRDNMQLIAVVLAAPSGNERTAVAKQLLDYGFANYAVYIPPEEDLPNVPVKGGKMPFCRVSFDPNDKILVLKGQENKISRSISVAESISAPVDKGQTIGKITYTLDDKVICEKDITALEDIQKVGFADIFKEILSRLM